jgi:hypothetical protein
VEDSLCSSSFQQNRLGYRPEPDAEALDLRKQKINIKNEGTSHDIIDNKGSNFISHDVVDNKGSYLDYPTMFMKTNELAFYLIPLTAPSQYLATLRGGPKKRKTNPRSAVESIKVGKNEPKTNPRIACANTASDLESTLA